MPALHPPPPRIFFLPTIPENKIGKNAGFLDECFGSVRHKEHPNYLLSEATSEYIFVLITFCFQHCHNTLFSFSQESFYYQQPAGPVRHPGPEESLQVSEGWTRGEGSVADPEPF
jgi:hypothetical protein